MRSGTHTSAEAAIARIEPNDTIIIGHMEPVILLRELCRQADRLQGLRLIVWPYSADPPYLAEHVIDKFRIYALAGTHGFSKYFRSGQVDYLPAHVTQITSRRLGEMTPTVALVHVAPADAKHEFSFGIMADYVRSYVHPDTRLVLAEANRKMPRTHGPNSVEESALDCIVSTDIPISWGASHAFAPDPVEFKLAEQVSEVVPDRATIQIGSSSLANVILRGLGSKRDLGFHSGSMTSAVMELIDAGTITNIAKPINRGISVTATLHGDAGFCEAVGRRSDNEVWPNEYTHDVRRIAQIPAFFSINSALQVDIAGQVYAEMIGGRLLGTTGGQGDFMRGAAHSEGGASIIALPSTTKDGRRSKITKHPQQGDLVTTPSTDVDFVITEHGIACLRGKSLRERMKALARIAAPAFRGELELEAARY